MFSCCYQEILRIQITPKNFGCISLSKVDYLSSHYLATDFWLKNLHDVRRATLDDLAAEKFEAVGQHFSVVTVTSHYKFKNLWFLEMVKFRCQHKAVRALTAARPTQQMHQDCQHTEIHLTTALARYGKAEILSAIQREIPEVTSCCCGW